MAVSRLSVTGAPGQPIVNRKLRYQEAPDHQESSALRSSSLSCSLESEQQVPVKGPEKTPGKLTASYRMPQFFQQTEAAKAAFARKMTKRNIQIIKRTKKLAEGPDQLVQGMSDFLQKVGYTNSFIGTDSQEKADLWQMIARGITNELSAEYRIFQENLQPKKAETEQYAEAKAAALKASLLRKKWAQLSSQELQDRKIASKHSKR